MIEVDSDGTACVVQKPFVGKPLIVEDAIMREVFGLDAEIVVLLIAVDLVMAAIYEVAGCSR